MKQDKNSTVRRLGRAAMFSAVRGLASAAAGAASLAWITVQPVPLAACIA